MKRAAIAIGGAVAALVLMASSSPRMARATTHSASPALRATRADSAVPRKAMPVVAVLVDSSGTELTDFMIPTATLREAGVARVVTVAMHAGRVRLFPGSVSIDPDQTIAAFDSANPSGADYVIVPAIVDHENAAISRWLRMQASRGATIVSICEGARAIAHAGLLDGRRATTHWHALADMTEKYPRTTWVRNQRYVSDEHLLTTAGVSASLPASIFLVERIAGRPKADSVARQMGIASWDPAHDTDAFHVTRWMYAKGIANHLAWWRHDLIGVPLANGFDEAALALTVDAAARTIRGTPFTWSTDGMPVRGRQGLRIHVDKSRAAIEPGARELALPAQSTPSAAALDSAITHLTNWYGRTAKELIEMGMEYPSPRGAR